MFGLIWFVICGSDFWQWMRFNGLVATNQHIKENVRESEAFCFWPRVFYKVLIYCSLLSERNREWHIYVSDQVIINNVLSLFKENIDQTCQNFLRKNHTFDVSQQKSPELKSAHMVASSFFVSFSFCLPSENRHFDLFCLIFHFSLFFTNSQRRSMK